MLVTEKKNNALTRNVPYRTSKPYPTFWYDPKKCIVILPNGQSQQITYVTLDNLLSRIHNYLSWDAKRKNEVQSREAFLFIRAGSRVADRPVRDWFDTEEWNKYHFRWGKLASTYTSEHSPTKIRLYGTCLYFGDEKDIHLIRRAYIRLQELLADTFSTELHGMPFYLHSTPAATGRQLIEMTIPEGETYKTLPDEIQSFIRSNSPQGRVQVLPPVPSSLTHGIYALDGRWMYAACMDSLPIAASRHDYVNDPYVEMTDDNTIVPKSPGLYHVHVRVPDGWQHIGLLKSDEDVKPARYPNVPGETFSNWITSDELCLALSQGWHIDIDERILWTHTHRHPQPLETLKNRLITLRYSVDSEGELCSLLQCAIRFILIHTIGSFNRAVTYERHETLYSDLPLSESDASKMYGKAIMRPKYMVWYEEIPLDESLIKFCHPEWAAFTWGKARSKLAEVALRLPYETIVSLRTDCLWVTDLPEWIEHEDTGMPGSFRRKDYDKNFHAWPENEAAMRTYVIHRNAEDEMVFDTAEE